MKRTRIVATIGPACDSVSKLIALTKAGVNVARLNFSHGTYTTHAALIKNIRAAGRATHAPLAILQDLSGPKIRVGDLGEGRELKTGQEIIFSNNAKRNWIPFSYEHLPSDVHRKDRILLDDGLFEVEVTHTTAHEIVCRVLIGGLLKSHKGMNVPTASLRVPAITEKDKKDLAFGLSHGVDWVALSFVRDPRDVQRLRTLIAHHKPKYMPGIIVKIEKHEAVQHLEEIMHAADAVMVARGDLGVEIPAERVPIVQKRILALAFEMEKPVVVATQMLDSMIRSPMPTRAEVSDVANAVFDGTDAVMLSGETAFGSYPLETVEMMTRIINEVELAPSVHAPLICRHPGIMATDELVGQIGIAATQLHGAAAVIIPLGSMHLALALSRFRPQTIIIPNVKTEHEAARLKMHYGMYPISRGIVRVGSEFVSLVRIAKSLKLIRRGDRVVWMQEHEKRKGLLSLDEKIV